MGKRKSMSKKLRFEVFKRDKFQCQYCGRIAPDVILEVDHVLPVVEGGDNSIMNLRTSCFDCNRGKGKRKLANDQKLKAEYKEIANLSDRREQIEMMMEWRTMEIQNYKNEYDLYKSLLLSHYDFDITNQPDKTISQVKRALKKYGYDFFVDITEKVSIKHYASFDDCIDTSLFINDIRKSCYWEKEKASNPESQKPYIVGILYKKYSNFRSREDFEKDVNKIIDAHSDSMKTEQHKINFYQTMIHLAKDENTFSSFLSWYKFSLSGDKF